MPAALAIDWSPIRDAAIAGVPFAQLAKEYEIEEMTIRQRAHRHKWPVPAHVRTLAAKHGVTVGVSKSVKEAREAGESVTHDLAGTLLANGEQGSLAMSNLALALLKAARPETLKPLADIGDVMTAGKAVRLPAYMDKENGASVNINLGGWQASVKAQVGASGFVEVEAIQPSDQSQEGFEDDSTEVVEPE